MRAWLLWLLVTSLFLVDGQLFLMLMRRVGISQARRHLWLGLPLAFGPLTLLFMPGRGWVLAVLLLGAGWHAVWHFGWSRAIRRELRPVGPDLAAAVWESAAQWCTRAPAVAVGSGGPGVFGWIRQTLVLPPETEAWPAFMRNAVLAHELAHVRHHDPLKLWFIGLVQRLMGWHPLARTLLRSLRLEIELAADEQASAWVGDAAAYAAAIGEFGLWQAAGGGVPAGRLGGMLAPGAGLSGYNQAELVVRLRAIAALEVRPQPLHIPSWLPRGLQERLAATGSRKAMRPELWQGFLLFSTVGYTVLLFVLLHWLG